MAINPRAKIPIATKRRAKIPRAKIPRATNEQLKNEQLKNEQQKNEQLKNEQRNKLKRVIYFFKNNSKNFIYHWVC